MMTNKSSVSYNIAFLSFDANENSGGVQRVSYLLARGFAEKGLKSFLIYDRAEEPSATFYQGKLLYRGCQDNEALAYFIIENDIKIVINNCVVRSVHTGGEIRSILDRYGCKMVSIIHAKPDLIKVTPSIRSLWWNFKTSTSFGMKFLNLAKILLFPVYKYISNKKYIAWRRAIYDNSDKVIVLSKFYIGCFCSMLGVDNDSGKVIAISNPLNFDYVVSENDVANKKKDVLVVSRLEESAKGLSRIFKAWQYIEVNDHLNDWDLVIVGSGEDGGYYKKLSQSLGLQRVRFMGYQPPQDYYKSASIFAMSSYHEGQPMTILEAEQMGLAIVAFNNFESLQELVINGENGILVENGIRQFADGLEKLMLDDELRNEFGMKSIQHSVKFSSNRIVNQWLELLNNI